MKTGAETSTRADDDVEAEAEAAAKTRKVKVKVTPEPVPVPPLQVDLDRYVPAYLTWVANKLSSGASQAYLATFGVGIETWRLLVLLAIRPTLTAQAASKIIGMDKASVSRAFKSMQLRGLIGIALDAQDGRLRMASITAQGRALHDQILGIALERERALLSVLSEAERDTLLGLLRRLHENLPAVEVATAQHLQRHFPNLPNTLRRRIQPAPPET